MLVGEAWAGSWSGNSAAALGAAREVVIVAPEVADADAQRLLVMLQADQRPVSGIVRPESADPQGKATLVLLGTPEENPLVAEVLAFHHVSIDASGTSFGGVRLPLDTPAISMALPSPWRPSTPVLVRTGATPEVARNLPGTSRSVSVWQRMADELVAVGQFALVVEEGRVVDVEAAPAALTGEALALDLLAAEAGLVSSYAGYESLDAALTGAGSSWSAHTAAAVAAARARESWSWTEAVDAIVAWLGPVQDTHFSWSGVAHTADGSLVSRGGRQVRELRPWFADLRLDAEGRVIGADSAAPLDLPDVPGPDAVEPGVAYRFPTLGPDRSARFLVGVFAPPDAPVRPLEVSGVGATELHPTRSRWTGRTGVWALEGDTLAVRMMTEEQLAEMPASADALRGLPRVILDLRGNYGGGDQPAWDWARRFSGGDVRFAGGLLLRAGKAPRERRIRRGESGTSSHPGDPYAGELFVLVDRGVASSGETFTFVAAQLPGAVLVGEGTMGCTRFGNVVEHPPLPNTGLVLHYGGTAFEWGPIRPVVEGVGTFPTLWLDEPDPVAFLRGLPPR